MSLIIVVSKGLLTFNGNTMLVMQRGSASCVRAQRR
ncbi:unnamed protein product [Schistosoma mattheei]|uniref:Uncharacterized protein n=1 Tax=Schistosoma mattheei TaxID=31246 RepID=A0A3P8KNK0_9TREM|nr:unnamed protein product [Schistosoma mattheei]